MFIGNVAQWFVHLSIEGFGALHDVGPSPLEVLSYQVSEV